MSAASAATGFSLSTPAPSTSGMLGVILLQNYTQGKPKTRHGKEILRFLDQGNNCGGLFNAKFTSSSNSDIPQFPFCLSSSSYLSLSIQECRSLTLAKLQLPLQSQISFLVLFVPSSSSSLAFVSHCPQIPGSLLQSHFSPAAHILPQTFPINHPIGFLSRCSCLQHPATKPCSFSLTKAVIC